MTIKMMMTIVMMIRMMMETCDGLETYAMYAETTLETLARHPCIYVVERYEVVHMLALLQVLKII